MKLLPVILLSFTLSFYQQALSQHVFSEKVFEYKRTFLPYDMPYVFPLEDKQFVILREEKKNLMTLGRYDQYFFEQWEREIEFDKHESVPQVFVKGDSVITHSFTIFEKKDSIKLHLRIFDLENGEEINQISFLTSSFENESYQPELLFSEDHSKFVIEHIPDQSGNLDFSIYELGQKEPSLTYQLALDELEGSSMHSIHLSKNGDLLLASVDPGDFRAQGFFWSAKSGERTHIDSNFFLERPADQIENIRIVRQGPSSYFIAFSACIEEELIGFSVLGVNVILKTVLMTYNQNFNGAEISDLYNGYLLTAEKQKKKRLKVPELLEDFRFVSSIKTSENDIILFFEELDIPVDFHNPETKMNMPWKHKADESKFYFGGDLLIFCFDDTGQIKWKKAIQKTQFSQANSLGLSFIPRMLNSHLDLLMYESSKGGNFYIMSINSSDGELIKKINLLPDSKFEFSKKYSCWLSPNSVLLLGIAPVNIRKRTLMLVEF